MSAEALRAIRQLLPDAEIIRDPAPDAALYGGAYSEPPVLRQAAVVEGRVLRAIHVSGEPQVRFAAFLDGIQRVRIVSHWRGVPIVMGTVSAVVRVRQHRRFVTWGHHTPIVSRRLYLPRCYIPGIVATSAGRFEIVDTAEVPAGTAPPSRHPGALRACAIDRIRADRERVERQLAEAWCALERAPICIDGGISASEVIGRSEYAVGVIKSHQTLYADGDALGVVLSLSRGERSSVFRVEHPRRIGVMSWYLRLRDPRGEDAMFGLVRVEAAEIGDITRRADEISAWILAESTPLSLPDGRWDKMTYGIRDCEEFLRAIAS
jgi:hypothetical protein